MLLTKPPTQIFLTARAHVVVGKLALDGKSVKLETRCYTSAGLEMLEQRRVSSELLRTTPAVDVARKMRN